MRRKKLGINGIILVVLAGLFQLMTLSLDQLVIQLEEKNRIIEDKVSKKTYEKEFYLENNRKIGSIIRSSSFKNIIISSSNFGEDYKEFDDNFKSYFYRQVLKSHIILIESIFADEIILNNLCGKKIREIIIPKDHIELLSNKVLDVETCKRFTSIINALNKWIKYFDVNEPDNINYESVQSNIDYNEFYLDYLLKYFGSIETKKTEELYNLNNSQYSINQKKQLFLLFSMVAQLISFLFLLLLFRRILK